MANSIGPHSFIFLLGNVPVIQQQIEVLTKPGEDSHRLRRRGLRSPNFNLESHGTYSSQSDARAALNVFAEMVDEEAVGLEKDDFDHAGLEQVEVAILNVEQLSLMKTASNTTGRDWLLKCRWTLRLTPF